MERMFDQVSLIKTIKDGIKKAIGVWKILIDLPQGGQK